MKWTILLYNICFFFQTTINADISTIFREAWNNVEKTSDFVPSMQEYKILTDLSDHTRLVYTVAREAFGGLVSSRSVNYFAKQKFTFLEKISNFRDFVNVNTWRIIDGVYTHASKSVEYSDMPPQKGKIRCVKICFFQKFDHTVQNQFLEQNNWLAGCV